MSAGEVDADSVTRGIEWLHRAPREASGPRWEEAHYTGTGFPRIFYLKYHGYAAFFPLWAMARYDRLMESDDREVRWGI
jgi:squalene-hopene/tetraprenyl-beta-curcumene cyclase